MILSLMASPVTAVAEAEMGFVGVTYWENDLSSVQVPICVTSQSLSEKKKHGIKFIIQYHFTAIYIMFQTQFLHGMDD